MDLQPVTLQGGHERLGRLIQAVANPHQGHHHEERHPAAQRRHRPAESHQQEDRHRYQREHGTVLVHVGQRVMRIGDASSHDGAEMNQRARGDERYAQPAQGLLTVGEEGEIKEHAADVQHHRGEIEVKRKIGDRAGQPGEVAADQRESQPVERERNDPPERREAASGNGNRAGDRLADGDPRHLRHRLWPGPAGRRRPASRGSFASRHHGSGPAGR